MERRNWNNGAYTGIMNYLYILILCVLSEGCTHAPLTQDELDIREEKRIDREIKLENWERWKVSCVANGGMVYIESHSAPSMRGYPGRGDTAKCVTKPGFF